MRIDQQNAGRIHDEFVRAGRSNTTRIDVDVSIGSSLPRNVRPRPVPQSIVRISPEFRGYQYVVVRDEVVIVEPRTRKVVTVIRDRGGSSMAGAGSGQRSGQQRAAIRLSEAQKRQIRSRLNSQNARSFNVEVREGAPVPQTVVLETIPAYLVEEIPDIRAYRYFVDQNRIVLVEPQSRTVVDIIE